MIESSKRSLLETNLLLIDESMLLPGNIRNFCKIPGLNPSPSDGKSLNVPKTMDFKNFNPLTSYFTEKQALISYFINSYGPLKFCSFEATPDPNGLSIDYTIVNLRDIGIDIA